MHAGHYAKRIGGEALRQVLNVPGLDGLPPHRFTKLVLDRWALEEPNRVRLLCSDPVRVEWLLEAAADQGDQERDLLTSIEAQHRREAGELDADLLAASGLSLGMPDSLPFRHMDREAA
ncbi:hypothetical protein TW86_22915 [Halomonas sp. S2151]|uniref:hypothetical protein n=1 Tax=Halomonas sp. S2151 TaxID=579478 RepID=UPI0005FA35A9|nr:hypothetical protein [Halomonas sp. S2151]KJZ03078.1 hypothetical protein TW86_22915 [Halomonas sp. S2151]